MRQQSENELTDTKTKSEQRQVINDWLDFALCHDLEEVFDEGREVMEVVNKEVRPKVSECIEKATKDGERGDGADTVDGIVFSDGHDMLSIEEYAID